MELKYSPIITKKCTVAVFVRIDRDTPVIETFNNDFKNVFIKLVNNGSFDANMKYIFADYRDIRLVYVTYKEVENYTEETWRRAASNIITMMKNNRIENIEIDMSGLFAEIGSISSYYAFCSGLYLTSYSFNKYFSADKLKSIAKIESIVLVSEHRDETVDAIEQISKEYEAVSFVRNVVNEPSNIMNALSFVEEVKEKCKKKKIKITVLDEKKIKSLGMGGLLGVNAGSNTPPRVLIAEYNHPKAERTVLVVGKGITFDTGGMNLKPGDSMLNMKDDMAGAASACASIMLTSDYELKINMVVIAMLTDNKTGSAAINPSDILKMYNGTTVEIISTDAEGRLILADGLSYGIEKYKPDFVIDIATLTGACSIALGDSASGLFGNDEELLTTLEASGNETYERVWRMPNFEEYKELIKSNIADIKNAGGRKGGVMRAGAFLEHFVGTTKWAHLDIASTAFNDKANYYIPEGASGVGVRLITRCIEKLSE